MNKKAIVSIILPTFNVSKYLPQCLDSVVGQTYKNIEIIVVIDGATDGSYEIALSYAEKDDRVKVIWQENAGSGPARNNGLNNAKGEYIIFVDPDDWVEKDMVDTLLKIQQRENVDLILTGYKTFYENESSQETCTDFESQKIDKQNEVRRNYLVYLSSGLLGAPTRKMYKMSIIKEHDIMFPNLRRSQDVVFNYRYYNFIESVYVSDTVFYHYRINEGEYNLKLKKDYYLTIAFIYNEIVNLCKQWDVGYQEEEYAEFCNFMLPSVIANIEANITRNESIDGLIENSTIQELVKRSSPSRMDQKLFRWAICSKLPVFINVLVLVKRKVKHR